MIFGFNDDLTAYCDVNGSIPEIVCSKDGPNVAGQSATVHLNFWDPKAKK